MARSTTSASSREPIAYLNSRSSPRPVTGLPPSREPLPDPAALYRLVVTEKSGDRGERGAGAGDRHFRSAQPSTAAKPR
jgi:hypothetical protein